MKQKTEQTDETVVSNFIKYIDSVSQCKSCTNCGQISFQFEHGICPLCCENNWVPKFETIQRKLVEKLGIKELMDN